MDQKKNFLKGFIRQNPVLVLLLGFCPTLGITTSISNGIGMGLAFTFVLIMSNVVISIVKDFIPDKVRIPCFIVIIASFVIIVELIMSAYNPVLYEKLGIFIPLIVVNCIVLGRAEAFASKNSLLSSIVDALGMGLGFACALVFVGAIREILGNFSFFDNKLIHSDGILFFVLAPGGFIVLAYVIALVNRINRTKNI